MGKQSSKIRTNKYVVYAHTGQVFLGTKYLRTLTDLQLHYVQSQSWTGKKTKLNDLLNGGDDAFEAEIELNRRNSASVLSDITVPLLELCNHSWRFLEKSGINYMFFCQKCIEIEIIENPLSIL